MTVLAFKPRLLPRQVQREDIDVLTEALHDDVNMAVWQRTLPEHLTRFAEQLLAQGEPLSQALSIELANDEAEPRLEGLLASYADIPGQAAFLADLAWLVRAYACLLDARSIGLRLRLRVLDGAMCPRFHVDRVPLRLITSYAGPGSQWLREGALSRQQLGGPQALPREGAVIEQIGCGHVALLKGERWVGNENRGLVHRSPSLPAGQRRLLLTLDWLG